MTEVVGSESFSTAQPPSSTKAHTQNAVYYPAVTYDYYIKKDATKGYGMYARRNMKKGRLVTDDGFEFMFSDVDEAGDYLLMDNHQQASKLSHSTIPAKIPLTKEMLERTHGVPVLLPDPTGQTSGTITWRLEVPGMLMNHSCNPTIYCSDPGDNARGEDLATRNIQKGEELTWDYCLQYYDKGPFFEKCLCGASTCRGKMMGFKALSEDEKKRLFWKASKAVQALYLEDIGQNSKKPLQIEQETNFGPRIPTSHLRLVVPGPSYALAPISIRRIIGDNESNGNMTYPNNWGLYATKDFHLGEKVYDFWRKRWIGDDDDDNSDDDDDDPTAPPNIKNIIDMVFATSLLEGDPPEGTRIRMNPAECAYRDRKGKYMFSGWDMLTKHSCHPNLRYDDEKEGEDEDWCSVYAARTIKSGDLLTVDYNSIFWDRSDVVVATGSVKDRTTEDDVPKGFKHLPREQQQKLWQMNWNTHKAKKTNTGQALSRHIRSCCKKDKYDDDFSFSSSSSSCSLSSSSSDESS